MEDERNTTIAVRKFKNQDEADDMRRQVLEALLVAVSNVYKQVSLRPQGDDLEAARIHACRLHGLGVQIIAGFKGVIRGGCPLNRAGIDAERAFREIVDQNDYCFLLDPAKLAERFREVANAATLAVKGDAGGAQALLEHLRTVPFDMLVGEVANAKCKSTETDQ